MGIPNLSKFRAATKTIREEVKKHHSRRGQWHALFKQLDIFEDWAERVDPPKVAKKAAAKERDDG